MEVKTKYQPKTERLRKKPSFIFETEAYSLGYQRVGGIDEVGRGCLAGPVVAACVILLPNHRILNLDDSKRLSPRKRESLSQEIYVEAYAVGMGSVGPDKIDQINILEASIVAMRKAISEMNPPPDFLLVDGNLRQLSEIPQKSVIHGDGLSQSIAAASIVAKVYRDQLMKEYHNQYPQYDFATNKGYPTSRHLEALEKYGMTEIHRKTFRGVRPWHTS